VGVVQAYSGLARHNPSDAPSCKVLPAAHVMDQDSMTDRSNRSARLFACTVALAANEWAREFVSRCLWSHKFSVRLQT